MKGIYSNIALVTIASLAAAQAVMSAPIEEVARQQREAARGQNGRNLIAPDPKWFANLNSYARKNGYVILDNAADAQIKGLGSAIAVNGPNFEGACSEYELAFVMDASRRKVWTVVVDADGRRVVPLLSRDGEMFLAGPAGVEPVGHASHGKWRTNRRHRKECRNQPH